MTKKAMAIVLTVSLGTLQAAVAPVRAQGPREGITVHGHWEIEVRNPDGTLAARQEFENGLTDGASLLGRVLSRERTIGLWVVWLFSDDVASQPFPGYQGSAPGLIAESSDTDAQGPNVFKNLKTTSLPNGVLLSGSARATGHGFVSSVETSNYHCGESTTPASCGAAPPTRSVSRFSGTALPQRLELQPDQTVQVRVTISFSSPSPTNAPPTATAPVISSFTASSQQVGVGDAFAVLPIFSNGTGVISAQQSGAPFVLGNAISGQPMIVSTIFHDATIILTVTTQAGVVATATLQITVLQ